MTKGKFTLLSALLSVAMLLLISCGEHDPYVNSFAGNAGEGKDYPSSSSNSLAWGGGDGNVLGSCELDNVNKMCMEFLDNIWDSSSAELSCVENNGKWSEVPICSAGYVADVYYNHDDGKVIYSYQEPVQLPDFAVLLAEGELTEGSIDDLDGEAWYKFTAAAGASYYFWWIDAYSGSAFEDMADVEVYIYDSDGNLLFYGDDENYSQYPAVIASGSSGFIYIKVIRLGGEEPDFSLRYKGAFL